jgi:cell division protein FtsZ
MVFVTAGEGGARDRRRADRRRTRAGARRTDGRSRHAPFAFEGRKRADQAERGIDQLRDRVDTLIVIENDRLLQVVERQPRRQAFRWRTTSPAGRAGSPT